jgi:hypothetical protein
VRAGIVAPSGAWYYTGNPGAVEPGSDTTGVRSDDEEDSAPSGSEASSTDSDDVDKDAVVNGTRPSHMWRKRPDPEVFGPLAKDMADAVLRMPQLQSGYLEIGTDYGPPIGVVFQCAEAGQGFVDPPDWKQDSEEEKRTRRWKVWVGTATEWEVPDDVNAKWKEWLGEDGKVVVGGWPPTSF